MASIRRIQTPAVFHDRPYLNGSPSSKSSSPSLSATGVRRFVAGVFHPKYSRRGQHIFRFLLFFLLGIVLGMAPQFRDDVRSHDFAFQVESPPLKNPKSDDSLLDTVKFDVKLNSNVIERVDLVPRKQLIIVTPTYNRAIQAYFLNRLAQTLRLVPPPLLWIVVEMDSASMETADLLRNTGVMYRHLVCTKNSTNVKDRGVHQRNKALEHIEHHKLDGIVYFADDDNIYSLELFESLREIRRFGTWPVAMLEQSKNKAVLEGPVCNESHVIGWHTNEKSKRLRRFHVDMSGFAFNSTILWDPKRWRRPTLSPIRQLDTVKEGFQETTFIEQVVEDESQMEGAAPGCSSILNWHLHLEARGISYPRGWVLQKDLDAVLPV